MAPICYNPATMEVLNVIIYIILFLSLYFEVFLLITFFESETRQNEAGGDGLLRVPTVAIIVPCWNEEGTIAQTIKSLAGLDYPKNKFEIMVIDDGSTDNTYKIAKQFSGVENLRVFRKENGGKHSAMNFALSKTNAEIVGCLDADSFVEPSALQKIVKRFEDKNVVSVTPSIKVRDAKSLVQTIQKAEYCISIFLRKTFVLLDSLFITPGPFSFFRRSAIDKIGHWREAHKTEDMEMGLRLQENNMKIENEPSAIVYTKTPETLPKLYKQRVRWTYGFIKNAYDYRHMFFNKKYGNLGLIVLPMAAISIITALFLLFYMIYNFIRLLVEQIIRILETGLSFTPIRFEPFYINTDSTTLLAIIVTTGALAIMATGKYIAKDKMIAIDTLTYTAFYGFVAPLWLAGATIKAITKTKVDWR